MLALLALSVVACAAPDADDAPPPAAGMCAEDMPDCVDVIIDAPGAVGPDEAGDVADAEALLGTPEGELEADVRVARRGDEEYALTQDYVVGRQTVELDDIDGTWRVTSVTVELTDGPVTVTAEMAPERG